MRLLVDLGNSRLKWACQSRGELFGHGTVSYEEEDLASILENRWSGMLPPEEVLGASVASAVATTNVASWIHFHWKQQAQFISAPARGLGVVNGYTKPATLGADRWAAMVAARDIAEGPVCIVDCGTALTIDLLDADGVHQGGHIIPGPTLMSESLARETAAIDVHPIGTQVAPGRSTDDCVQGGILRATLCAIEGVRGTIKGKRPGMPTCVISGGSAEAIRSHLSRPCIHVPDLVLRGLALYSGKNL